MPIVNLPLLDTNWTSVFSPNDVNFGDNYFNCAGNTTGSKYRYHFKIDESLLEDKFIISAVLHFNVIFVNSGSAEPVHPIIANCDAVWAGNTLTYNNQPTFSNGVNLADIATSFTGPTSRDITSTIQNKDGKGFVLLGNSVSNDMQCHGMAASASLRPYLVVEYSNTFPFPPTLTYPDGVTVDRSKDLKFQWSGEQHLSSELIWNDGSDHVVNVPGNTFEYTLPGGSMLAGNITWKVRMEYSEVGFSEYSDESLFVAADKPATPVITTTAITTNLPTIDWSSVNQTAFNIIISSPEGTVVDFTSYVSSLSYALTQELLDDTEYTIELRIQDTTGLWSDFDTEVITSNFPKPDTPTFVITDLEDHIQIVITNGLNTEYNEVMKEINGEYVAIKSTLVNDTVLIYELVSGITENLKVRAYRDGGGFADSVVQTATVEVLDSQIVSFDDSIKINLSKTPKKSNMVKKDVSKFTFVGRSLPVAVVGELKENKPNWSFEVFDYTEVETVKSLTGIKCLFRDKHGFIGWFVIVETSETILANSFNVSIRNVIEVNR